MPIKILFTTLALMFLLAARAEEQPSPVLTSLPSTTVGGYVNSSTQWNPGSSPVRFEDLCRALRERGFQLKKYGRHHLFRRCGKAVLYLCKQGPFARPSDVLQVRRFLISI